MEFARHVRDAIRHPSFGYRFTAIACTKSKTLQEFGRQRVHVEQHTYCFGRDIRPASISLALQIPRAGFQMLGRRKMACNSELVICTSAGQPLLCSGVGGSNEYEGAVGDYINWCHGGRCGFLGTDWMTFPVPVGRPFTLTLRFNWDASPQTFTTYVDGLAVCRYDPVSPESCYRTEIAGAMPEPQPVTFEEMGADGNSIGLIEEATVQPDAAAPGLARVELRSASGGKLARSVEFRGIEINRDDL